MKKLLFSLFVCLSLTSFSQTQTIDTNTIEGLYQYMFANLDKTQIASGYLEDTDLFCDV